MNPTDAFNTFYDSVLQPKLEELEDYRKKIKNEYYTSILFTLSVAFIYIFIRTRGDLGAVVVVGLLFSLPITFLVQWNSKRVRNKFSFKFKEEIIGSIVRFNNPALTHDPEKGILSRAVEISKIFSDNLKKFDSNDLVEGKLGSTFVQFSNVKLKHNTFGMDDNFHGLFMIATFNKRFTGEYYVISNRHTSSTGSAVSKVVLESNMVRPKLIKTDNPLFEREFSVFASDPIEAMYILTPSLMQRMLDVKEKVQGEVHFSFIRSRLFAAIPSKDRIFYPPINEQAQKEDILAWNHSLHFALGLVNDLHLNTRIWTVK